MQNYIVLTDSESRFNSFIGSKRIASFNDKAFTGLLFQPIKNFSVMKKKLFFAGAALLLAAAAVTGYSLRGESNLSALLDANVEALAGNEEGGNVHDCPGGSKECVRVINGNTVHIYYMS